MIHDLSMKIIHINVQFQQCHINLIIQLYDQSRTNFIVLVAIEHLFLDFY